jgi:hypothetical protein
MGRLIANKLENGKMEEDVKPEDEDGVDGRGVCFSFKNAVRAA